MSTVILKKHPETNETVVSTIIRNFSVQYSDVENSPAVQLHGIPQAAVREVISKVLLDGTIQEETNEAHISVNPVETQRLITELTSRLNDPQTTLTSTERTQLEAKKTNLENKLQIENTLINGVATLLSTFRVSLYNLNV